MESYGSIDERRKLITNNTKKWGHIGVSSLGVGVGLGGGITGFHFKNLHLGSWGLVSGSFAAVLLHLAILYKSGLIDSWYSAKILGSIIRLGIAGVVVGIAGTAVYITIAVVQHHGNMLPQSFYYSAVGSCLTIVWSIYLVYFAWRLKTKMERENTSLLGGIRPYPDGDE